VWCERELRVRRRRLFWDHLVAGVGLGQREAGKEEKIK